TVFTLSRRYNPFSGLFAKKELKKTKQLAKTLIDAASEMAVTLPNARLLKYKDFEKLIWECYHRDLVAREKIPSPNFRFKLANRVAQKPVYEDGFLRLGDTYTRVITLIDYPDADIDWFYRLAKVNSVEMHITQIIKPLNVRVAMSASSRETERSMETASSIGGEDVAGKVTDHNTYRQFVNDNNLRVFHNCYIIKLHCTDKNHLTDVSRLIVDCLGTGTVTANNTEDMAFAFWRISMPALGHHSSYMRQDHTLQVANMAPVIKFSCGDSIHRQMLRITDDSQAVTFSYPPGGTNHSITVAKTGGVKVLKQWPKSLNSIR
ncbi:MAG: hypothetical protein JKY54_05005, partial [Flavobacteriales bacterium]|nr:hypothetical protein [Flavobacteriales bacterium]